MSGRSAPGDDVCALHCSHDRLKRKRNEKLACKSPSGLFFLVFFHELRAYGGVIGTTKGVTASNVHERLGGDKMTLFNILSIRVGAGCKYITAYETYR